MDFSTLTEFRRKTYACFDRAADVLMNVADALLTQTPARSLAELSLSPCFERHWLASTRRSKMPGSTGPPCKNSLPNTRRTQ